ncbi:IS110 family transposase [Vibrio sp. SS-MA-C1-2]|uniref:IS110 family transposase n=1 Tax=Vibrio sp. SS-MA-C1-2 TaxID=2908646 RepID=UPI001F1A881E|nr:IS110 family transposase [Vibrio sp. SS-MA-C1-2]UJF17066.1 IS110 family transposase [Vibrio sp. SS-MA-C1-2]
MKTIIRVGVDIAKNSFHIYAVDQDENKAWKGKYSRSKWLNEIVKRVPKNAIIGIEACGSAHYWSRELQCLGYTVKLIAPQFVKPYVKTNKNDMADAEAICEAISRPNMRFVSTKTVEQQDIQAMHRLREDLVTQRTAKANQIRGLTAEYGIVAPTGIKKLRESISWWLEDAENNLTPLFREVLQMQYDELKGLDEHLELVSSMITASLKGNKNAERLMEITGIGPLICSALLIDLGNGSSFKKGRDFAASLGLVPKQHSTGGKERLLGISKRGNGYLRKLLVHGARSAFRHVKNKTDPLSLWIKKLSSRKHSNIAIVALANKIARISWALVSKEDKYNPSLAAG